MLRILVLSGVFVLLSQSAFATIYSCTDKNGRRHTSDRPIAACLDQKQRVLKPDGSLKTILPAAMSPRERMEAEQREREAAREQMARQESIKRDRMLLRRYPDEARHQAARMNALNLVHTSIEATQRRLEALRKDRKPLLDKAAAHQGTAMPGQLKQQLNANDAMLQAQQSLVQNQTLEAARINALYDKEATRLGPMWRGMPAGSHDALAGASAAN